MFFRQMVLEQPQGEEGGEEEEEVEGGNLHRQHTTPDIKN